MTWQATNDESPVKADTRVCRISERFLTRGRSVTSIEPQLVGPSYLGIFTPRSVAIRWVFS